MRLAPYEYIHVLDRNTNYVHIVMGPKIFVQEDHEELTTGDKPMPFIILKPDTYAVIANPVVRNKEGKLEADAHGQVKVHFGYQEIRTDSQYPEPFPLYPYEILKKTDKLTAIPRDYALKVKANRDFKDKNSVTRHAGDEWLIEGPSIYVPRIEEDKVELQAPIVIDINKALKLKAQFACLDKEGKSRESGEEWLIRKPGTYMLGVHEVLSEIVNGIVLTEKKAIKLIALKTFTDVYGIKRKAGEEWLVRKEMSAVHICDVYEKVLEEVPLTVLRKNEYVVLLNPRMPNGTNDMGKKVLIQGPKTFFLNPGEELEGGIKQNYILGEDEALLLKAIEDIYEEVVVSTEVKKGKEEDEEIETVEERLMKKAGERWMIHGPINYVPPCNVEVLERRKAIPMDAIEGVYVRDTRTGAVREQKGKTYMLTEYEELANKEIPESTEEMLMRQTGKPRTEKYRLVTYKCPFNACMQIFDYKEKKSRIKFGPALVSLAPEEQFTFIYLSGSTPKKPGRCPTLYLLLGPTFSTDIVEVETSDHAKLTLKMAFYWQFRIDKDHPEKIFSVRDFIGDLVKTMGSRVRSVAATVPFETFHKSSALYINQAIFGIDSQTNLPKTITSFEAHGLEVTNVDIQSIEPVDKRTKESLDKTVTQAISITTKMQQQIATNNADNVEQQAEAELAKTKLKNSIDAEEAKKAYLELQAKSEAAKVKGKATADASAYASATKILSESEVNYATLSTNAKKTVKGAELDHIEKKNTIVLTHKKKMADLKVEKAKALAKIESDKFTSMVNAIDKKTLIEIAKAGPEMQAAMLQGLGLQGYMLMDSKNPINLFTVANGMVTSAPPKP
jgi:major vault protein